MRVDFATVTPCRCTTSGSTGMASWSLFCTLAQARSGSVPAANVRLISPAPEESLVEAMYSMRSRPVIFCSMIWITLSSTVLAEAPG